MIKVIEKNIILLSSLLVLITSYGDRGIKSNSVILIFLCSLIFTELAIYIENSKVRLGILVAYIVACLVCWQFTIFLPVAVFFVVEERIKYGWSILLLYIMLYGKCDSSVVLLAELVLCTCSGLMSYETRNASFYKQKYQETRDSSTELENMLKQKNRELIESQDANVSMATLKERNRIAREIHDNVGHMLSRTILQTGALMTIYKEEPLHEQIKSINESLSEAMNNIRESVHDLHDESVDLKLSILETIKPLKENFNVEFEYDMSSMAGRNIKYCFISIVKEATSNIIKHSNATNVYILMREHPGFFQLAVEDNGDSKIDAMHAGIGLSNMRDRVESLMGNISISDEKGFKILVSIPKNEENL